MNGGLALPASPQEFSDGWSRGFNIGGGVSYRLAPHLLIVGTVNYNRFPFDQEGLLGSLSNELGFDPRDLGVAVDIRGADASVVSVEGDLKVSAARGARSVSPYVVAGLGVAHISASDVVLSVSIPGFREEERIEGFSESAALASFGGGIDIPMGKHVGLLLEGRYEVDFTEGDRTNHASFKIGLRIGG